MSSATNPSSVVPSPFPDAPTRSIPSLDELYAWTSEPDRRVVIPNVDWTYYEQLVDSMPEWCHLHVDYDGINLEIMCLGPFHHHLKGLMGRIVSSIAEVGEVPVRSLGQATWKRAQLARGLQADDTFVFRADKLDAVANALARRSNDIADYPNPDLGIEVDISSPKIDRSGIYAALQVIEVWRFEGKSEKVVIERLDEDGRYYPIDASAFLPIRAEEVRRWVIEEDSSDQSAWARRLRAWVRAELAHRRPGRAE
jgi:Uma2 family endonuclease